MNSFTFVKILSFLLAGVLFTTGCVNKSDSNDSTKTKKTGSKNTNNNGTNSDSNGKKTDSNSDQNKDSNQQIEDSTTTSTTVPETTTTTTEPAFTSPTSNSASSTSTSLPGSSDNTTPSTSLPSSSGTGAPTNTTLPSSSGTTVPGKVSVPVTNDAPKTEQDKILKIKAEITDLKTSLKYLKTYFYSLDQFATVYKVESEKFSEQQSKIQNQIQTCEKELNNNGDSNQENYKTFVECLNQLSPLLKPVIDGIKKSTKTIESINQFHRESLLVEKLFVDLLQKELSTPKQQKEILCFNKMESEIIACLEQPENATKINKYLEDSYQNIIKSTPKIIDSKGKNTPIPFERLKIEALFNAPNGNEIPTIREHTQKVLNQYEKQKAFFNLNKLTKPDFVSDFDGFMRYLIVMHDVGKPFSKEIKKHHLEVKFTIPIALHIMTYCGFESAQSNLILNLINYHELIGNYLQNKMKLQETVRAIKEMSKISKVDEKLYFHLLYLLFIADASSYDTLLNQVFDQDASTGQLKPKDKTKFMQLYNHFKWTK